MSDSFFYNDIAQQNKTQPRYPYFMEGDGNEFWAASHADYIKISMDAVIFTEYNACGMDLIVRNDKGKLFQAITKCNFSMVSVSHCRGLGHKGGA